ncbi:PSD1 and planctomycete cytochrome C domain-containing protein [Mariniblastus fucicola]|uniref:Planctomycete cytochrome C n=1 Tax=Mariniblastus fucicola TaxID=980251 RepID=A0A5B9P2E4_9BACT|nr:PSD1 and planctomycete cytochrome C domain-containing protein [Mariniblastus fucicola]QEG20508.1 Planctomycete cytochrome C [Mariniblastus fucicola]
MKLSLSPILIFCLLVAVENLPAQEVNFTRDIRPILSDKCFHCHGNDEETREAGLRLDQRDAAIEMDAITPGSLDESAAWQRIVADEEDIVMPPPHSHKTLSDQEKEKLRQWIEQGAVYEQHWSYRPIAKPEIELTAKDDSPIDVLIRKRLEQQKLAASEQADRVTLIRRLSLDLTGLPPTGAEIQTFLADDSPNAYENLVDRLLNEDAFGERMAVFWLDLVRYADTIGYHSDNSMEVSAYRDYVINAFNANKPFDEFTIEQLAGDLLPDATTQQKIASGYNRLLQTTQEGGAQPKEYIAIYAADRVRNVSGVWMGQTMGCAQCHDHKYDPITAKDFYAMSAFFSDIRETPVGKRVKNLYLYTDQEKAQLQQLEKDLAAAKGEEAAFRDGSDARKKLQMEWEKALVEDTEEVESQNAEGSDAKVNETDSSLQDIVKIAADKRSAEQQKQLDDAFLDASSEFASIKKRAADLQAAIKKVRDNARSMLVSDALPKPRMTKIKNRGDWMDESGEVVLPAVPEFLPSSFEGVDRRLTRLDLAKWMVDPANPLTSRTFVNRLWKIFYGRGLSNNLDDLGGQGEPPTHPELLDWLAAEFQSDWDVKRMAKLMVMSQTYRQSSVADSSVKEADPANLWYARQSRWRIDAEFVRDTALQLGGLLNESQIGGRSVKPYQPQGYWQHLNFPKRKWTQGDGSELYRKSLYTFWCRSFLHPTMLAFDAPTREECVASRARSNIPQQALVLLNDPIFVEAARGLAIRMMKFEGDTKQKIEFAWQESVGRKPLDGEIDLLVKLYENQQERFADAKADATALLAVGESSVPDGIDVRELAAWTQVARAMLNAYETISRH